MYETTFWLFGMCLLLGSVVEFQARIHHVRNEILLPIVIQFLMNLLLKSIFVHNVRDTLTGQSHRCFRSLPSQIFVTLFQTMRYITLLVWQCCKNVYFAVQAYFEKRYNIVAINHIILRWMLLI